MGCPGFCGSSAVGTNPVFTSPFDFSTFRPQPSAPPKSPRRRRRHHRKRSMQRLRPPSSSIARALRPTARSAPVVALTTARSQWHSQRLQQVRHASSAHAEETFEEFTTRYTSFFKGVQDIFELQRGLNNCFAYDLVPAPSIIEAALYAARRVNDYGTAVRIFEGIEEKVENQAQYEAYLAELKNVKDELGASKSVCAS